MATNGIFAIYNGSLVCASRKGAKWKYASNNKAVVFKDGKIRCAGNKALGLSENIREG